MPYSVSSRPKAETTEIEYIVVSSHGMAPHPYGGPFALEVDAIAACERLKKLTIEEWFAAHPESQRGDHIEGHGEVCHIAPDGRWIQHKGRNTFAVHPPTDLDLEIDEMVNVGRDGKIDFLDRRPSSGISR